MEETPYKQAIPRKSSTVLDKKGTAYIVPQNGAFHYYSIKVKEESLGKPIMRFEKRPPLLVDGWVSVKRKLYAVTMDDILRGIIRKSREVRNVEREIDGYSEPGSDPGATSSTTVSTVTGTAGGGRTSDNRPSAIPDIGMEVWSDADLAFDEQVRALLDLANAKEGGTWEVQDIT